MSVSDLASLFKDLQHGSAISVSGLASLLKDLNMGLRCLFQAWPLVWGTSTPIYLRRMTTKGRWARWFDCSVSTCCPYSTCTRATTPATRVLRCSWRMPFCWGVRPSWTATCRRPSSGWSWRWTSCGLRKPPPPPHPPRTSLPSLWLRPLHCSAGPFSL